ncbi:hypothetical protein V9K67_13385 [Paraflavisolibacter sp. H34]|uniref:hypothetical protein n=1 Tax=Huijunlia imazamoxiresistens TaxID=3127457 RepID=UPI003019357A
MRRVIKGVCLALAPVLLLSFVHPPKKRKADIAGHWVTGNPSDPKTSPHMKVFEENGSYYCVGFEQVGTVLTHKGRYKVVDDGHFKEKVTNVRFNAQWDLRGKEFLNNYELSKDGKSLVLSGVVYSRDGKDSLRWSHRYRKLEVPE